MFSLSVVRPSESQTRGIGGDRNETGTIPVAGTERHLRRAEVVGLFDRNRHPRPQIEVLRKLVTMEIRVIATPEIGARIRIADEQVPCRLVLGTRRNG